MDKWRRPYEIDWSLVLLSPVVSVLPIFVCIGGAPFAFGSRPDWRDVVLSPGLDLFFLAALVLALVHARAGVYLGDAGVMVRVGFRRVVVPWQEIAYAEVADMVPPWPMLFRRRPSPGLLLVAPSGYRRPVPAMLAAPTLRGGRGYPPYVVLSPDRMTQVVNSINESAAGRHPQAWPPPGGWSFPPR